MLGRARVLRRLTAPVAVLLLVAAAGVVGQSSRSAAAIPAGPGGHATP